MFGKIEILTLAQNMAAHASARQTVVAQNVANADTPGYHAKDIQSFAEVMANDTGSIGMRTTRDGHITGSVGTVPNHQASEIRSAVVAPNGNSVSLETEMMRSVEVRGQHDLATTIYRSAMTIMRSSLGR